MLHLYFIHQIGRPSRTLILLYLSSVNYSTVVIFLSRTIKQYACSAKYQSVKILLKKIIQYIIDNNYKK